jgi:hypothetical protein
VKVFHYTPRGTALEHILTTGKLRFGRLPRTNDPREFAPLWFTIGGRGDLPDINPFEMIAEADRLLRESVHLLCLSEDRPNRDGIDGRYGNGPRRARMWAQYAGNHTGVCLVFDKERLIEAADEQFPTSRDRSLLHQPVQYLAENEHPRMPMLHVPGAEQDLREVIEAMVRDHADELFFTKDWDWMSESEYRFLLRGETNEIEEFDVSDALEAVIAGQQFHRVYKPGLWKLCQEIGVDALEIQWQTGPPMVVKMIDPARKTIVDGVLRPPSEA